jgi:hypothetical protein
LGGSCPAITAHGSLDLKQEIQIQIQINKLSSLVYKCLHNLYVTGKHKHLYLLCVEKTLNDLGLSGFCIHQENLNVNTLWFKEKVKRCLQDQFV